MGGILCNETTKDAEDKKARFANGFQWYHQMVQK